MQRAVAHATLASVAIGLLTLATRGSDVAAPDRPWEPPETLSVTRVNPAIQGDPALHAPGYLFIGPHARPEKRVNQVAGLVGLYLPRPPHVGATHMIHYPELSSGDVFPVFSHLYVLSATQESSPGGVSARRVRRDELPSGLGPRVNLWSVPLGGTLTVHGRSVELTQIRRGDAESTHSATVEYSYGASSKRTQLHEGDRLNVGGWEFEVSEVVPPDPQYRVIGWLTLMGELRPAEDVGGTR